MLTSQIEKLLEKPEWTTEECQWALNFLESPVTSEDELRELMQKYFDTAIQNSTTIDASISERLLTSIHQQIDINKKPAKVRLMNSLLFKMAAACVIGALLYTTYLTVSNTPKNKVVPIAVENKIYHNDVNPGGDRAILTLADGSSIILDTAKNGMLTQQGTTKIIIANGKLDYKASNNSSNEVLFNTISTPRGGQYQVQLSDGSLVWLNAASSLRFPTVFSDNERIVEITGEVYFEVAQQKMKNGQGKVPFIVKINSPGRDGGQVEVLGTHFNINSYQDESTINATIFEGAVKYVNGSYNSMLQPGQQSQFAKNGQLKVVSGVNLDNVLAWKNGLFNFDGMDFEIVAKQLSRWYDVDVVCNRKVNDLFYADIPRNTNLSDVLKALELTGKVKFKINGKQIIVMP